MSTASTSANRAGKRPRRPSPSPTAQSNPADEARSKSMHDRDDDRFLGLPESQAQMNYQEDYRPVMAVDIGELPPRKYGDVVRPGKLTTRHGYKDIPEIAEPLLRAFPHVVDDYPQLGKFLLLDGEGNVSNAAIHQLMARVCSWPNPKKVRCRFFEVNNMIVRLSPVEFSMITGLHFQDLRTDEDKDKDEDLKEIAFPDYEESKKQVSNDLLFKKIKKLLSKNNPERYPFVINLTFVWLITNLLDIPNRQLNVPDEFFKLCSNLDACQNYPWGIKAWVAIVDDCFSRIGEIEGPGRTRAWNAYGFIHFYAFWMLEALEGADVQLDATRRREYRHSYPRMLRWSLSNNSPKNEDFKKFLVNDVQVVYPRLKPDVVELRSSYFHGTLCWFERRYFARRADALRLNDDDIFCDDYVSFIAAPPAPAPSPSPPRRQRTLSPAHHISPAHHTTYSAFPESFQDAGQSHFQAAGQSSDQAAGLPSWWGGLQQMNTEMMAEMRAQRELISAQSRQIAVQTTQIAEQNAMMTRYGTQLDGYGDQLTRYGTQLDGYGVQLTEYGVVLRGHGDQITSLQESFREHCNLGDRPNEFPPMEYYSAPTWDSPQPQPQAMIEYYPSPVPLSREVEDFQTPFQPPRFQSNVVNEASSSSVDRTRMRDVRIRRPSHFVRSPYNALPRKGIPRRPAVDRFRDYLADRNDKTLRDVGLEWPVNRDWFEGMSAGDSDMDIYHINAVLGIYHNDFEYISRMTCDRMKNNYTIVPCSFFQTLQYVWEAGDYNPQYYEPVPLDELQSCIECMAKGAHGWKPKPWAGLKFCDWRKRNEQDENAEIVWETLDNPPQSHDYIFRDGIRYVRPYYFEFISHGKNRWAGRTIVDLFADEFKGRDRDYYVSAVKAGRIQVKGEIVPVSYVVKSSQKISHFVHRHEPPVLAREIKILHCEPDVLTVYKPASVPVHPCGQYRKNTVTGILEAEHDLAPLFPIHRLDRLVSGLLIIARNSSKADLFRQQIESGEVKKQYIARVLGVFPENEQVVNANVFHNAREGKSTVEVENGSNGSSALKGKAACTKFTRISTNGTQSIILCEPITGRTHQIRVHLQFLGYPIANDMLYLSESVPHPCTEGLRPNKAAADITLPSKFNHCEISDPYSTDKSNEEFKIDPMCTHCPNLGPNGYDGHEEGLWLHCFRYSGPSWTYDCPYPDWASLS